MRKLSYLSMAGFTWYLAGMYRSVPLTVLFLAELVLFAALAVQSLRFRRTVTAGFPAEWTGGEKNTDCRVRVFLSQRGRFPVGRARLTLALSYGDGKQKLVRRLYGGVEPRTRAELEFYVCPPCCGPVTVELRHLRVYDALSLFPAGRRCRERMYLAVFPPPRPLRIVRAPDSRNGPAEGNLPSPARTDASPDPVGPREYQPGDSARSIHWKQSARTDTLWSREYGRETGGVLDLRLELSGGGGIETWDAFYEILSAIALGLLPYAAAVRVFWRDGGMVRQWDVSGEDSRRELFFRLCQSAPPEQPLPPGPGFRLDTALRWRRDNELIYQFSPAAFSDEIAERIFYLNL